MKLVYQLNHFGSPCMSPDPKIRSLTVVDATGIHTINHTRCGCRRSTGIKPWQQYMREGWYPASVKSPQTCATFECLDLLRRLKVIATVNVRDFMTVLEDITDAWATFNIADRYKIMLVLARQWAFLQRVRRSGLGMDGKGLENARPGCLAVVCWACPRPGVNLPTGWQSSNTPYVCCLMTLPCSNLNLADISSTVYTLSMPISASHPNSEPPPALMSPCSRARVYKFLGRSTMLG